MLRLVLLVFAACITVSCGVVYKVPVNQGNLLEQEMVESLKPGMTKRQVALIMGTPSVQSPFDQDRWSYTSSFAKRGKKAQTKTLTLYFDENVLVRMEGDYFPERDQQLLEDSHKIRGRHVDPKDEPSRREREAAERRRRG